MNPYYFPLSCVLVSLCHLKFARSCILKLVQKPARTRLVNCCPLTMLLSASPPVDTRSLMIINRNCHQFTSFLTLRSVILFHTPILKNNMMLMLYAFHFCGYRPQYILLCRWIFTCLALLVLFGSFRNIPLHVCYFRPDIS